MSKNELEKVTCPECKSPNIKCIELGEANFFGPTEPNETLKGVEIRCLKCGHIEFFPG